MSQEQINRVKQAIAECDAFISKESVRNAEVRTESAQKHLDYCIAHKAKLLAMMGE